jgi:hypothetical protein
MTSRISSGQRSGASKNTLLPEKSVAETILT